MNPWTAQDFSIRNAKMVLADRVMGGGLRVEGGVIVEIGPETPGAIDFGGHFVIPAAIDLHTDHVEKHVIPRGGVRWDYRTALLAHDAVVAAAGIGTVFDSLSVGAAMANPERREILGPLVDALETLAASGAFRAEHWLHMRCEISDPDTIELVDRNIGRDITRLVSSMDHTPGDRQSLDIDKWTRHMAAHMGVDLEDGRRRTAELMERSVRVGATVRAHIAASALRRDLPLMSHDDRTEDHVDLAQSEGASISEFPTTLAAARYAKAKGLTVIAGAPNYLLGGSQSGNVALKDLLAENLVDALASDYVPASMISAAFAIAADPDMPQTLPAAVGLITAGPARLAGLADRGEIAVGKRADLARVAQNDGRPRVAALWREGARVS